MRVLSYLVVFLLSGATFSQGENNVQPLLTVKQIMNSLITPTTAVIWGAYELEGESEWQEVKDAALALIGAGNLLTIGGSGEGEALSAQESDWKTFNSRMISAAWEVISAVESRDEEALFAVGNDELYPPCESCHQRYQTQ